MENVMKSKWTAYEHANRLAAKQLKLLREFVEDNPAEPSVESGQRDESGKRNRTASQATRTAKGALPT